MCLMHRAEIWTNSLGKNLAYLGRELMAWSPRSVNGFFFFFFFFFFLQGGGRSCSHRGISPSEKRILEEVGNFGKNGFKIETFFFFFF